MTCVLQNEGVTEAARAVRYTVGDREIRPWGSWEVLATGDRYILKRITVAPGQRLSLQYHQFRSEHWIVVAGVAEVERDDCISHLAAGQSIDVPAKSCHRIRNVGDAPLTFIEVQHGELLDELDIIRLADDYSRT